MKFQTKNDYRRIEMSEIMTKKRNYFINNLKDTFWMQSYLHNGLVNLDNVR